MAPPKPPPFETLALKLLPVMLRVLERPWMAPPLELLAALVLNVQFAIVTVPNRVKTAAPP
jgi:hypothetical protein